MIVLGSVFLDFNLPNATTWFYFSFLLAMALFFKFARILSIRNWDVVTIFLLVPGLLLLHNGEPKQTTSPEPQPEELGKLLLAGGSAAAAAPVAGIAGTSQLLMAAQRAPAAPSATSSWFGYLWLLIGSAYLLLRCLFDLVLVRRPALGPNLTFGGLLWLGGALFICLTAVAYRPPYASPSPFSPTSPVQHETVGKPPGPLQMAEHQLQNHLGATVIVSRTLALLCHLSVVVGLIIMSGLHFHNKSSGVAAATFYLLLPYTGRYVGQLHHVWPMALVIWALVCYRRPTLAGMFLGLATGISYFPALLLPIWTSFYWGRGVGRFLLSFLTVSGACLGTAILVLWLNDTLALTIAGTLEWPAWQPWLLKSTTENSIWLSVHWAYRLPVFILYLAFVVTTAFWPSPKNLGYVLALSTAVLIGIQFWYADQGGVYILWYLPLFLLMMFRPNLSEHRPPPINPETDWLTPLCRYLWQSVRGLFRKPDSLVRVR